mmetsp:Transcript_85666/g.239351  ORF Transcript_85666/g.239351 Transcript_85666/m.239351 type:complete len:213 (+) Transcript_85666:1069-1707(+)
MGRRPRLRPIAAQEGATDRFRHGGVLRIWKRVVVQKAVRRHAQAATTASRRSPVPAFAHTAAGIRASPTWRRRANDAAMHGAVAAAGRPWAAAMHARISSRDAWATIRRGLAPDGRAASDARATRWHAAAAGHATTSASRLWRACSGRAGEGGVAVFTEGCRYERCRGVTSREERVADEGRAPGEKRAPGEQRCIVSDARRSGQRHRRFRQQ